MSGMLWSFLGKLFSGSGKTGKPSLGDESALRRKATELKRSKRYAEAVACLLQAREAGYAAGDYPTLATLMRVPQYLALAGDHRAAAAAALEIAASRFRFCGDTNRQMLDLAKNNGLALASEEFRAMGDTAMAHACMAGALTAKRQHAMHELARSDASRPQAVRGIKTAMSFFDGLSAQAAADVESILVDSWRKIATVDPNAVVSAVNRILSRGGAA
jgi:hypothetical protein